MKKSVIPNLMTLSNLLSGVSAIIFAFKHDLVSASIMIFFGSVLDFFDGTVARLLKATSTIGKDLDSFADLITFSLAPSMMIYNYFADHWVKYLSLIIPVFGALRLARFNNDPEQKLQFKGLPTPAAALFFIAYLLSLKFQNIYLLANPWAVGITIVAIALLMISPMPMLSFKTFNRCTYLLIIPSIILLLWLKFFGLLLSIILYISLSVVCNLKSYG